MCTWYRIGTRTDPCRTLVAIGCTVEYEISTHSLKKPPKTFDHMRWTTQEGTVKEHVCREYFVTVSTECFAHTEQYS